MTSGRRTVGLVVGVVASVMFAVYAARTLRGQDLSMYAEPRSLAGIATAALLYALVIPISAWVWRRFLADLGTSRTWRELVAIMSITQAAKYLPGSVAQHLGRAGMALASGIALRPLTISVAAETLLAAAAAAAVGLTGAVLSREGLWMFSRGTPIVLSIVGPLAAGLLVALMTARRTVPWLVRRFTPSDPGLPGADVPLRTWSLMCAFAAYCANYVIIGVGIVAMASQLLPAQRHDSALLTGSFALAWTGGFLAFGAPAGLGVREGLMLAMLRSSYSGPDALVLVIAHRLATVAGDIVCLLAGTALALTSSRPTLTSGGRRNPSAHHKA